MEDRVRIAIMQRGFCQPLLIGQGGFGRIYRVREVTSGKLYACKVAVEEGGFHVQREADILKELHHPLFPRFLDAWKDEGCVFFVMEYVAGNSLEELISRRGRVSEKVLLQLVRELAEGLALLHKRGLIFRDIKPSNILIRQDGRVKLIDFGCVCRTGEKGISKAGTVGYGAPEQLLFGQAGAYSDVYALGRVMQSVLLGRKLTNLSDKEIEELWRRCICGKNTRKIVDYCVQKNIESRISSMEVLIKFIFSKNIQLKFRIVKNIWKSDCE